MNTPVRISKFHSFLTKAFLLTVSVVLGACSIDAKLAALLSQNPTLNIIDSDGIVTTSTKSAYHVYGRCPVESTQVTFINSSSVLTCTSGFFDGHIDLSAFSEGSNTLELHASTGVVATWNFVIDTTAPIVLVGVPVTSYTGLNKAIDIPVSFSESSTINLSSSDVVISGTATNNCAVSVFGSGSTARTIRIENCDQPAGSFTVAINPGIATDAAGNISIASNTSSAITIDNVAPLIAAISTSADTFGQAGTFTWELNFTDADSIPLAATNVALTGATAGCTKTLTGTGLTQRILSVTGCTGNGALNIAIPAGAAKDFALNSSALLNLDPVTVDNQGPTLSLGSPTPTSGNSGTTFSWVVTYTGATNISLANTDVSFIGNSTGCSASISGSGTTSRTVQVSGCTDTGTLKVQIAANSAQDGAGNQAPASAQSIAVSLHNTAVGIAISSPTPAAINAAGTAQFTITYTNASNYTLTATDITFGGASTDCTKTLSGSGPTFTVSVTGCSSNGNVQLSVAANTANDGNGNNAPAAGPSANLAVDNTAPTIAVVGPTPTTGNSSTNFQWTLNFTGASTVGLTAGNISFTGASAGCVATISGTGLSSRVVSVTGCSGNGSLDLSLAAAVIADLAGNTSAANSNLGAVTVDNIAPTLAIGTPTPATGTSATEFVWPITYTGANAVSLVAADVALTTSLTGCTVSVSGTGTTNRDVKVTGCLGDGTLKVGINAGSASDTAGNLAAASALSDQVVVNNSQPTIAFATPSPTYGNSSTSFSWVLTFTGATTVTMTDADVQLQGTTTGCVASVTGSGVTNRTVSVTGCSGTGTMAIRIAADAIKNASSVGNLQTSSSSSVNISSATPSILVTGLPVGNTPANTATTTTSGPNLASYIYKVGPVASTNCLLPADYSAPQAAGNVTLDLSSFSNVIMIACYKGTDVYGNTVLFQHRWNRDSVTAAVPITNICGSPASPTSSLTTTNTSGILSDSGGTSADYGNNESCVYTITTGAPITLNLESFDTESNWDFLWVYDGPTATGTEIKKYDGVKTGETVTANSGSITLKFTSDGSVTKPGFVIGWGGATSTGSDFSPNTIAVTDVVNGTVATQYTQTFTVSGISGSVFAGITGFDAQIMNVTQGTTWRSWVNVANNDSISIRMTSGATTSEARTARLGIGSYSRDWKIYWDYVAPVGTISIAGGAANSLTTSTTLDFTINDASGGPYEVYVTQDAGCTTGGTWAPYTTPFPWMLRDGGVQNTVYAKFRDTALNESTCVSDTINQDNLANPTVTLTSTTPSTTTSMTADLIITFSEPVTGLTLSDFTTTNATISNLAGSGANYTATVTASSNGSYGVTLAANSVQDLQGNANPAGGTISWFVDSVPPVITLMENFSLGSEYNYNVIIYTDDDTITVPPTSPLTITNGSASYLGATQFRGKTWFTYRIARSSEGTVTAVVPAGKFADAAGNTNAASNTVSATLKTYPVIQFSSSYLMTSEASGSAIVNLSMYPTLPTDTQVKVIRSTAHSPTAGLIDSLPEESTVTFLADQQNASISVPLVNNGTADGDKIITLSLSIDNNQVQIGAQSTTTIHVTDDETTKNSPIAQASNGNAIATIDGDGHLKVIGSGYAATNTGIYTTPQTIDPSVTYTAVVMNTFFGCALSTAGEFKCWGYMRQSVNTGGTQSITNLDPGYTYKQITVDDYYNAPICGITTANKLRCRGANDNGILLTGNTTYQGSFIDVAPTFDFNYVDVGTKNICAVTTTGDLYCWGDNSDYQLANGSTSAGVATPTQVDAGTTYSMVKLGFSRICGITTAKALKCWGRNYNNSLGNGNGTANTTAQVIDSGTTYKDVLIKSSQFGCGITESNNLKCWGNTATVNNQTSETYAVVSPVVIPTIPKLISGYSDSFCLMRSNDMTVCNTPIMQMHATKAWHVAQQNDTFVEVTKNATAPCGLKANGVVKCMQSGDGHDLARHQFVPILTNKLFTTINGQDNFHCGITTDDKLYCWGGNYSFYPNTQNQNLPNRINAPANLKKVFVGPYNVCVTNTSDDLYCMGDNSSGQIGDGTTTNSYLAFTKPNTTKKFSKISMTYATVCGLTTDSKVLCWGTNPGNGTASSLEPVDVLPANNFIDVGVNIDVRCALRDNNKLYCWGLDNGSLTGSGNTGATVLTPVASDTSGSYVSATPINGLKLTCGVTTANKLRCFGPAGGFSTTAAVYDSGSDYTSQMGGSWNAVCAKTTGGVWKCFNSESYNYSKMESSGLGYRGLVPIAVTH